MWTWNESLRETLTKYDDNKYIVTDDKIVILYPKFTDKLHLDSLNRNEMLCYLRLIKNPPELIETGNKPIVNSKLCDICGKIKDGIFHYYKFNNYSVIKCDFCKWSRYDANLYFNESCYVDSVEKKPNYVIDITFLQGDYIVFLYRQTVQKSLFNFENVVSKSWYVGFTRIYTCGCCDRHVVYTNSRCKQCYDFSYQLSNLNKLVLLSESFNNDIFGNILFYYANLMNINISYDGVLTVKNKTERKFNIKEEEILENLYFSDVDYDEKYDEDSTEFYESITDN